MKIQSLNIKRTPFECFLPLDKLSDYTYFAGIGSRETPIEIGELMIRFSYYFSLEGLVLRSGGAEGADTFFEIGADLAKTIDSSKGLKQIFLPEKNFFEHPSQWYIENEEIYMTKELQKEMEIELGFLGGLFHKGLATMEEKSRKLMLRNGMQVMGPFLNDPSMAVICWTPDGAIDHSERKLITGGTGQAISIAACEYITIGTGKNRYIKDGAQQVLNLSKKEHLEIVLDKLNSLEQKHGKMPDWKTSLNWLPIKNYKQTHSLK